jgi:hypothetical protein
MQQSSTCCIAHAYLFRFLTSCDEPASKENLERSGPAEATSLTARRLPVLLFFGIRIERSGLWIGETSSLIVGDIVGEL